MKIGIFWTQKDGNQVDEYEDAFAMKAENGFLTMAIADGITEGSFSARLAQMLTSQFIVNPPKHFLGQQEFIAWSKKIGREWLHTVKAMPDLPWWTIDSIDEGTGAAFLGITVRHSGWLQAVSVGDAVLFIVNPDKGVFFSWPIQHSQDFGDEPHLIRTKGPQKGFKTLKGIKVNGDDWVIAATDALAASILKMREESIPLMGLIETLNFQSKASFKSYIAEMRQLRKIRNDDSTVIIAQIGGM